MTETRTSGFLAFVARAVMPDRDRNQNTPSRDWIRRLRVIPAFAILLLSPLMVSPLVVSPVAARAQPPTRPAQPPAPAALTIANDAGEQHLTATELLARPDCVTVDVDGDIYHHTVPYRAVPLLALLGNRPVGRTDTLEARASDGFVSQIPLALIARGARGGAVAWIAVEDPAHPWPPVPHGTRSAGPFYLIWQHPERSGVTREQWPYQLAGLSFVESPARRWPQLLVPANLPEGAPARHGQDVFVVQCLPCHRLNGAGGSDTGPDLGRPMNPTQYLTEAGLRAIIRDPRAVRTWPGQLMAGFGRNVLSDADLDAVAAYLRAMAPPRH